MQTEQVRYPRRSLRYFSSQRKERSGTCQDCKEHEFIDYSRMRADSITKKLGDAFEGIKQYPDLACGGPVSLILPAIFVEGVGNLSFPLSTRDAITLLSVSEEVKI